VEAGATPASEGADDDQDGESSSSSGKRGPNEADDEPSASEQDGDVADETTQVDTQIGDPDAGAKGAEKESFTDDERADEAAPTDDEGLTDDDSSDVDDSFDVGGSDASGGDPEDDDSVAERDASTQVNDNDVGAGDTTDGGAVEPAAGDASPLDSEALACQDCDAGDPANDDLTCTIDGGVGIGPDCLDQCPGNPKKTAPGVCGCGEADVDSDGDDWFDCEDECPQNPDKIEPGACGCDEADVDSDGDDSFDCEDECPMNPSKVAPGICGCISADTDADGDGLANCIDDCPMQPAPTSCGCDSEATCLGIGPNLALESVVPSADADSSTKLDGTANNDVRDGDATTYWAPDGIVPDGSAATEQRISVKWLGDAQTYDTVILREVGNRVQAWRLEDLEGQVLATGTTIGFSTVAQFSSVQSERVNVFITRASALPWIAEIEVYDTR
jgi:hypothetical protein